MQIVAIQNLRAIAAISVSIGHAQAFIGVPMERQGQVFGWSFLLPWGAGVDLFFVISGFIMVYSSERLFAAPGGAKIFAWRRLSRIVPLYWCAMVLLLIKMAALHKPMPDAASVVSSFFFIPWDTQGTGVPRPIYDLGWTLNYEMFFYSVFALCVGLRREMAVALIALCLSALVLFGLVFPMHDPQLFFWSQPIVVEFVFGMGLALLVRHGIALPAPARYALIAAGAAAFFHDFLNTVAQPHLWLTPNDFLRVAGWGIPAAMIVAGCVLKRREELSANVFMRAGKLLGDASYALYLCHPIVMSAFAIVWFGADINNRLPAYLGAGISIVLAIIAAILVYLWFELPLTRFLQRGMRQGDAPRTAADLKAASQRA
ncbi:MAG: acyltransferase [Methylobacteriaceae bacterium]|nr:acyltransferase [Methylobacteriaceae bacterium]